MPFRERRSPFELEGEAQLLQAPEGVHDPIVLLDQARIDRLLAGDNRKEVVEILAIVQQHSVASSGSVENGRQQALGPRGAEILNGLGETGTVHLPGPLERARQHRQFVFWQPIEIVQQVDQ